MQRIGRSIGFRIGSLFGMAGATVMCIGLYTANFLVMCGGGLILGYAVACLQMYRFAAAELVPIQYRAKAISWVTAGGVAAAVIGPSLVRVTHDLTMPLYVATYAAILVLHVIVFTIMSFISFPSVTPAASTPSQADIAVPPRPLLVIASQPRFIASAMAGMLAFGTMSFIMSASPLAIVACGFPHAEAHWVIFMHVLGMFVPSFFTGNLINRFGATTVMACGVALMLAGVVAALSGLTEWNFRIALTVNGVGWNFLFVGATTLVTTCYRPNERGKTQALNDLLVFSTTATSSFMAGFLQDRWGWQPLNWFSVLLMLAAAGAVVVASLPASVVERCALRSSFLRTQEPITTGVCRMGSLGHRVLSIDHAVWIPAFAGRCKCYFTAPSITSSAPLTIASKSLRGVCARARMAMV